MHKTAEQPPRERSQGSGPVVAQCGFDIQYLAEKQILMSTLKGFWSDDTAHQYRQALECEMAKIRRTRRPIACLSDARDFPVQTEAVMKILAARSTPGEGARKLAIVVSRALNTMQAQRSFPTDRVKVFKDMEDATAWLEATPAGGQRAARYATETMTHFASSPRPNRQDK